MDRDEALKLLRSGPDGVAKWNRRREGGENIPELDNADLPGVELIGINLLGANLSGGNLTEAKLRGANLSQAKLRKAKLRGAELQEADLRGADLLGADLAGADLLEADLSVADLRKVNLAGANLNKARLITVDLRGADLSGALLMAATLLEAKLTQNANLTGCRIYGISAWRLELDETTIQSSLVITDTGPTITVDNIEVAQFIYLLLNNKRIKYVIDTITSKVVLILGRFRADRKIVLDAIREELRRRDFTPILFDFDKPASKDVTGTVETLARMARFIIADLTDPSSIPHELAMLIPSMRTTPVLLLQLEGSSTYSMIRDYQWDRKKETGYPWVLSPYEYRDGPSLIASLPDVIAPADQMAEKLRRVP
jgi:hypothetical protein